MEQESDTTNKKEETPKKKRGATQLLKAASFVLGRPKKPKPIHVDVESKSMWRRLVGSRLPLHDHNHTNQLSSPTSVEHVDDTVQSSVSQSGVSSSSCSEASVSRYASVANLEELDRSEDDDDDDDDDAAYNDCDGGDEMIDVKADMFIARFYEQMRLQRMDSTDRRYHEMNQRSIG